VVGSPITIPLIRAARTSCRNRQSDGLIQQPPKQAEENPITPDTTAGWSTTDCQPGKQAEENPITPDTNLCRE